MSEQLTNQPEEKPCKQIGGATGAGFMPGKSGNPRGRALIPDRIRAEVIDLVARFEARHGRPPTRSERSDIEVLADRQVQAKRDRLPTEDRNKAARTAAVYSRKLGIDRPVSSPRNGSDPYGGELLRKRTDE
jgi:hypothetical protein